MFCGCQSKAGSQKTGKESPKKGWKLLDFTVYVYDGKGDEILHILRVWADKNTALLDREGTT